ncbi:cornifelin homolog B-like isoform X2 [Hyperolius riggenbachi]|uniref:cornifelin homolog B-like isoform X2 n=1 Tax=Hyperolius riggenbachi TaxID=752182 RepID=UPI0035A2F433
MVVGSEEKNNLQLPVIHVPPTTPIHMVPATVPMQVPMAVPIPIAMTPVAGMHAIVTQPQPHTSIVLNMQGGSHDPMAMGPRGGPMACGPISWSSGLCQCFEDLPMCLIGCVCPCLLPCYVSALFGELCCLGLLPGAMFALRTGVRERYRIPGSLLNDYCAICCCTTCALCQMAREVKARQWHDCRFPVPPLWNQQQRRWNT